MVGQLEYDASILRIHSVLSVPTAIELGARFYMLFDPTD
jgi:hypothetical protein